MSRRATVLWLGAALVAALVAVRGLRAPARPEPSGQAAGAPAVARADVETRVVGFEEADLAGEAFGRVLDPLPFVDAALGRSAARRAYAFAEVESRRVEGLYARGRNASTRDVEAARLALEKARVDLRSASARVAATWGARAAERGDLEALADDLAAGRVALARVDLPAGEPAPEPPERLDVSVARGAPASAAIVVGPAPATDPLLQGEGYLVRLEAPPPVGTSVVASVPRRRHVRGLFVPESAIVWRGGSPIVFVQAGEGFEGRPVRRLGAVRDGWLVAGDLRDGDRVVVRGAQQILSEQLFSAGRPPPDSGD